MSFIAFPSIKLFHNVVRTLEVFPDAIPPVPVRYRSKVKLHGTNAAIQIRPDGSLVCQSRTAIISSGNDNKGFARWIESNSAPWAALAGDKTRVIFGEWCGPGIEHSTGIQQIPNKIFALFAIAVDDRWIFDPDDIMAYLNNTLPPDTYVLPWHSEVSVDYRDLLTDDRSVIGRIPEELSAIVDGIEPVDPWVKENFGKEGTCEGLVYYPDTTNLEKFEYFAFKAKGEKHKVMKTRNIVQLDPEMVESVEEFVTMFVTPTRLQQGVTEGAKGVLSNRLVGPFIAWMLNDVRKESTDELEVSGLAWRQVEKEVVTSAREWYLEQIFNQEGNE